MWNEQFQYDLCMEAHAQYRARLRRDRHKRRYKFMSDAPRSYKHAKGAEKPVYKDRDIPDNCQEIYDASYNAFWGLERFTHSRKRTIRAMSLAYGFLNGTPYKEIENSSHYPLNFFIDRVGYDKDGKQEERKGFLNEVQNYAHKYSDLNQQDFNQRWAEWYDGLVEHLKAQAPVVEVNETVETPQAALG